MAELQNDIVFRLTADSDDFLDDEKKEVRSLEKDFAKLENRASASIKKIGTESRRSTGLLSRLRSTGRRAFRGLQTSATIAGRVIASAMAVATAGITILLQIATAAATGIATLATIFATLTLNSTKAGRAIKEELVDKVDEFAKAATNLIKDLIPIGLAIIEVFKNIGTAIADFFIDRINGSEEATENFGINAAAAITAFAATVVASFSQAGKQLRLFSLEAQRVGARLAEINAFRVGNGLAPVFAEQRRQLRDQIKELRTEIRENRVDLGEVFNSEFASSRERFSEIAEDLNNSTLDFGSKAKAGVVKSTLELRDQLLKLFNDLNKQIADIELLLPGIQDDGARRKAEIELARYKKSLDDTTESLLKLGITEEEAIKTTEAYIKSQKEAKEQEEQRARALEQLEKRTTQAQLAVEKFKLGEFFKEQVDILVKSFTEGEISAEKLNFELKKLSDTVKLEVQKQEAILDAQAKRREERAKEAEQNARTVRDNILGNVAPGLEFNEEQLQEIDELAEKFKEGELSAIEFRNAVLALAQSPNVLASALGNLSNSLGQVSQAFGENTTAGKVFLAASKTIAAAQIGINTALQISNFATGISEAFKLPFPASVAAVAVQLGTLATIIANIRSLGSLLKGNEPQFYEGTEFVTGKTHKQRTTRDGILARINHGERIFSTKDNTRFKDFSNPEVLRIFEAGLFNLKPVDQIAPNYSLSASFDSKSMEIQFEKTAKQIAISNAHHSRDMKMMQAMMNKALNRPVEIKQKRRKSA